MKIIIAILILVIVAISVWGLYLGFAPLICPRSIVPFDTRTELIYKLCPNSFVGGPPIVHGK